MTDLFSVADESRRVRLRTAGWADNPSPAGRVWFPPWKVGGHGVGVMEDEAFAWLDREDRKREAGG